VNKYFHYNNITGLIYQREQPQAVLKQRNFDPETRTLRKRDLADVEEDTVERNVEGVAEQIIAEDEERRQQELVRASFRSPIANGCSCNNLRTF